MFPPTFFHALPWCRRILPGLSYMIQTWNYAALNPAGTYLPQYRNLLQLMPSQLTHSAYVSHPSTMNPGKRNRTDSSSSELSEKAVKQMGKNMDHHQEGSETQPSEHKSQNEKSRTHADYHTGKCYVTCRSDQIVNLIISVMWLKHRTFPSHSFNQ